MKTLTLESNARRPLCIDFNLYTDGDADFKKELIVLMIDNIRELQHAQQQVERQHNYPLFLKACHKVKSTLSILNDRELLTVINYLSQAAEKSEEAKPEQTALLNALCNDIVKSLEQEKE